MVNTNKLRARIVEQGSTIGRIADKLGISAYTMGRKIAGKTAMTLNEAFALKQLLEISDGEEGDYFFTPKVANGNTLERHEVEK